MVRPHGPVPVGVYPRLDIDISQLVVRYQPRRCLIDPVGEVFGGITSGDELLGDHVEHLSGPVGVTGQMREQFVDPDERGVAGGGGDVVMAAAYPRACGPLPSRAVSGIGHTGRGQCAPHCSYEH